MRNNGDIKMKIVSLIVLFIVIIPWFGCPIPVSEGTPGLNVKYIIKPTFDQESGTCTYTVPDEAATDVEYFSEGTLDYCIDDDPTNYVLGEPCQGKTWNNGYWAGIVFKNMLDPTYSDWNGIAERNHIVVEHVNTWYDVMLYNPDSGTYEPQDVGLNNFTKDTPLNIDTSVTVTPKSMAIVTVNLFPKEIWNTLYTYAQTASSQTVYVNVHIKLIGHTFGDTSIESNEFVYPIYFCEGCLGPYSPQLCSEEQTFISWCFPGQDVQNYCK